MKQELYLECNTGISGDMTVAALLDLGADEQVLRAALASLKLDGYQIQISRVSKSGIDACDFNVILETDNHDHDMEYLHGHDHHHDHDHHHGHDHHHDHDHHHGHDHHHDHDHHHGHNHHHDHDDHHDHDHHHPHEHHHAHAHRGLPEILDIINGGQLSSRAKSLAIRIFEIVADAESKAHGVPVDQVHFHEVGAVDSIVDIVAVAVCMDDLGIEDVVIPELCEGRGMVRCQHGLMPVPVPATLNVVTTHQIPLRRIPADGEFVTPTGAAIAAAIRTEDILPERYRIVKLGIGAGKREYDRPSLLRAMLIEVDDEKNDMICKLECNVDDCTGEMLGYTMERLMEQGARDAYFVPVYMKKNRPAYLISVICDEEKRELLEQILFAETTTIGIRRQYMERTVLHREGVQVTTSYGDVAAKKVGGQEDFVLVPEYEAVAKVARETGKPFRVLYKEIEQQMNQ